MHLLYLSSFFLSLEKQFFLVTTVTLGIILDVEETAVTEVDQVYNKILAERKLYPRWYQLSGFNEGAA